MDQEKVEFIDTSTDVERALEGGDVREVKLTLCAQTCNKIEVTNQEASTFRDKPVVNDGNDIDDIKNTDVFVSSLDERTGDSLEKRDDATEISIISNLEVLEKKVNKSDGITDPCDSVNSEPSETESDKLIELLLQSSDESSEITYLECEERRDSGQEIIVIDDKLDSYEPEANNSRTSNNDLDQVKSNIKDNEGDNIQGNDKLFLKAQEDATREDIGAGNQKEVCSLNCKIEIDEEIQNVKQTASNVPFIGDSVSACSVENIDYPESEREEHNKNVVQILDNTGMVAQDGQLEKDKSDEIEDIKKKEKDINKSDEEIEDIKTNIDLNKSLPNTTENNVISDDIENTTHHNEAQKESCIERIQPLKISCEQLSESLKDEEIAKSIICSGDEGETKILQPTLHHDHEDNAIANKSKEEDEASVQGVEVMEPKETAEIKDKHTESENTVEDGIKDSQRPRSRSYPFKVLVSGLPLGVRREDMMCYFSQFGEVLKLWDEGRHKANVLFADEESFKKAVSVSDPYFDDHKLLIRSLNEVIAVISGIPRNIQAKVAEKAIKDLLEEAGALPCRIIVPLSDPSETSENNIIQGHAFVAFNDPHTLQKAVERETKEPFVIIDKEVKLHLSCNEFYEKFCIRVYPLLPEHPRMVLYHNIHAAFESVGEIVTIMCQYLGKSAAYGGYVLFESEESVEKALKIEDVKILGDFAQVQIYHPFDIGQGFRHLWLKVHNLPPRATITEIKHHFGHDKGILNVELDLDFGSCFMHVNSEPAMQRCLRMHQTYLRGKCITVLIAEDHPDREYFRDKRGRRPNFRNNFGRKRATNNNSSSNFSGKTFTSTAQPQGSQDRKMFERGDRKFSKSRSNNNPKEVLKVVKEGGDGVKMADTPAV